MTREGFSEAGLAIGSVAGMRTWQLLDDKGLKGQWGMTWTPGENVAVCRCKARGLFWHNDGPCECNYCGCGLWGYWSATDAAGPKTVLGVVEGYGPTLIGELGFRSMKAKIVALCVMFRLTRIRETRIERPLDPGPRPPRYEPPPGMFRRGPGGMDTYRALIAAGAADGVIEEPSLRTEFFRVEEDDADALALLQNDLEMHYDVPVYSNPSAMLVRHPPTRDYLPQASTWG